ncbi:18676_t:CDS:10, partial [Gigaspora rosea]
MSNKRQNSANELRRQAFDLAGRAVNEDKKGHREKAKKYYLEVINMFGAIVQTEPDQTERDKISTKCHEYKMRVEQLDGELKNAIDIPNTHTISHGSTLDNLLNQAQSIQNQAQSQEEQKNYVEALDLYTKAAEIFFNAIKETKNGSLHQQLTTKVNHLLERAEELKGLPTKKMSLLTVRSANYGKNPSSYKLTQKEIDILKHTSNINGRNYLPWDETDLKEEFKDNKLFLDPDGPVPLSDKQKENFGGWKRPSDIMSNPKMITRICSSAIKEDIVNDCSALTGWIPEVIFTDDSKHFNKDNVWKKLLGGHKLGHTLITITTGDMTDDKADEVGLVPTHSYAVLDVREINGLQLLQVKNPWSIKRWTGPYSHLDANNWTPDLMSLLNYDRLQAAHNDD